MHVRAATHTDVDALTELTARFDFAHFGAVEHSADEVREFLDLAAPLEENTLLVLDDGRVVAAAQRWGADDSSLLVDPDADAAPLHDLLVPWFAEHGANVEVRAGDAALQARLAADGWRHRKSAFDLIRRVEPGFELALPEWPDGVTITDLDRTHLEAVHHLIYIDAAWAEVPGHPQRDLANWSSIFVNEHTVDAQQVLAWRDGRIVGVALGRTWDDGTGWVAQLATAKDERGRGLGRALLLEALHRRVAAGATALGLTVQATNAAALRLYLDVGLSIDREWQTWVAERHI